MRVFQLFFAVIVFSSSVFAEVILVPPGNRYENQPSLPGSTVERIEKDRYPLFSDPLSPEQVVEIRFKDARDMLLADINSEKPTLSEIKKAAALYGIDPVHIVGAIMGEHTYNVGGVDQVQDFLGVVASWAPDWALKFESNSINLVELIQRSEFTDCPTVTDYDFWFCVQDVWANEFRGRVVGGQQMPDSSLRMTFFNPFYAGHTYGLGQLDPLRALMVSDYVSEVSGFDRISVEHANGIYAAIVNPYTNVHYMAANLRRIIDVYYTVAGFDISQNPGIVATLYNLGNEPRRAEELRKANANSSQVIYPKENYYGWFVNKKEQKLREMLEKVP